VSLVQRGRFITFEGGEGTGKSTQARLLVERLAASGIRAVATREPGGSPGAEAIRALVLNGAADRWSPVSETLLMYAARADHLEKLIRPALAEGAWVVCDRFYDSTRAYQGAGGGAPDLLINALQNQVAGADRPDLTLVLDVDVETGLRRAVGRDALDRFESMDCSFHERLRQGFLAIARHEPERCVVASAAGSPDEVSALVWRAVQERLGVGAG
jgi:dTMP kinase